MAAIVSDVGRVVEREWQVYKKMWRSSVFSMIVSPLLYLLGLGIGLGGLIDDRAGTVEGMTYLEYLTPGLLAGWAMQVAAGHSLWPVMAGTTWVRFFHGVVATPVSAAGVFGGYVAWIGMRAAQLGVVFLTVAALLGGVPSWWGVLALPVTVLTALAFAAPMVAFSGSQQTDLSFPLIIRLGAMPLFLFSATFFPIDQLPGWLHPLAWFSPLWHGVELCRAATTGQGLPWAEAVLHLGVLLTVGAAGAAWGAKTFTRKLAS
jgi:lipooligosaccharide transport system permease protein